MSNNIDRIIRLKAQYRLNMLNGELQAPEQIIELIGYEYRDEMESFFQALWHRYLMNKSTTSTVYWHDKFNCDKIFNEYLFHLSEANWITVVTKPKRNWSEVSLNESKLLQFVSSEELSNIRESFKFEDKKMKKVASTKSNVTKLLGKKTDTGLNRPGFAKAGNSEFRYDTKYIEFYYDAIEMNLTKSMRELGLDSSDFDDNTDYASLSKTILEYHLNNPLLVMTTGANVNDSRGRAISDALKKIFNPISNKDARSLLVIQDDRSFEDKHLEAVYLFIAELVGSKKKTRGKKAKEGKRCYQERVLHTLDLATKTMGDKESQKQKEENKRADEDRKELHENIWCERIYDELDAYQAHKEAIYSKSFTYRIQAKRLSKYDANGSQWHQTRYNNALAKLEEIKASIDTSGFHWSVPIELDGTALKV